VGAGRHEELYVVLTGRAEFTVAGDRIDAPAGTLVFVPELSASRHAVASESGTTVLVIGGPPRNAFPISPFEYWYSAEPAYRAGDYARAIEIVSEGLADWPDHPTIHYQLACYNSLAGDRAEAISHLRRAFDGDASLREWALEDTDLDPIRDDPEFPR
jgi:tetratricopeptide (TPR) repeat protein